MEKNKKIMKFISIICLSILFLFVIGIVISITSIDKQVEKPKNDIITDTKIDTFESDIKKLKEEFSLKDIEIVDEKCEIVNSTLISMLRTLSVNEKINENWSSYCSGFCTDYSYSGKQYYMSFFCNIDNIKTTEEMKEIIKDCSQIIWESLNLIYSNPNINNDKNMYFRKLKFAFSFKYSYIDKYGNTLYDSHNLNFETTRYSYNKINMETFPTILDLDYTKMFELGTTTHKLGTQGIQIDFKNLLTK